jgi:hypothetical protein
MNAIDRIMLLMAREIVKHDCPEVLLLDETRLIAAIKERYTLTFEAGNFALVAKGA